MARPQTGAPQRPASSQTVARSRPRRKAASGWRRLGVFLLGLSAVVLLLVTAGLVGVTLLYSSDLVPGGFQAFGVTLGGGTQAQAAQTLARAWDAQRVTVDLGQGQTRVLHPEDLGVTLDVTATVRLAHDEGRSTQALEQMLRSRQLTLPATPLQPVWKFDQVSADRTLQELARATFVSAQNASVRVTGGRVETTPPVPGRALDLGASGARLGSDPWAIVEQGRFQPVIVPVTPPITDTSAAAAQIQAWLAAPLSLHLYDPVLNEKRDWQITPQTVGDWVTVGTKESAPGLIQPALDEGRLKAYLDAQVKTLGEGRYLDVDKAAPALLGSLQGKHETVRLRIYHSEREHVVQAGETISSIADGSGIPYPWIQKANPGLGDAIRPGQTIKVPAVDALIPLTPIENKRIVVSIKEQKMWAYENGALKWQWPASTGMSFSPTSPGIFQIQTHEKNAYAGNWDLWMPYFMGVYRPVPDVDFMNGFHGFPSRGGSQILWTNDLGHPITYGCILLSTENATALYQWAEEGVVVEIKR